MLLIENGVALQHRGVTTRIIADGEWRCSIETQPVSHALKKEGLRRPGWLITSCRCRNGPMTRSRRHGISVMVLGCVPPAITARRPWKREHEDGERSHK